VSGRDTTISGIGLPGDAFELNYAYDPRGNPSRSLHPVWSSWGDECSPAVERQDDFEGRWRTASSAIIEDSPGAAARVIHQYHPSGRLARTAYFTGDSPDGYWFEDPDPHGMPRPSRMSVEWNDPSGDGTTVIWTEGLYEYDGSGNIWRIGHRGYTYDGVDRLRRFDGGGTAVELYEYDRWGNLTRLVRTDPAAESQFELEMIGAWWANRPSAVELDGNWVDWLTWDARGNLTGIPAFLQQRQKRFTFSDEDRLMVAEDEASKLSWRFAYDVAGERIASWRRNMQGELDELRLSIRDESGAVLADWTLLPGESFGPTTDYLYAGERMVTQLSWVDGQAVPLFATHDHLGSTRMLVAPDGTILDEIEYYPFGEIRFGDRSPTSTHLFTGHERDLGTHSTELDYLHARYYSPTIARFLSIDPVGAEPETSQSWNSYTYAVDNPLRSVDPDGRYEEDVHRDLTRYMALAAGWTPQKAGEVARKNIEVDEINPANPLFPGSFSLHFGPRDEAVEAARNAGSGAELGRALHSVQDSFSHEGYGWPFGHGHMNLVGRSPDDPWRDPNKAIAMAELSFELLGGDPARLDRGFLSSLFSIRSKEQRIKMIEEAARALSKGGSEPLTIDAQGQAQIQQIADYYESRGYTVLIDGRPR
jgi:RHS repeat-associated protein